jgi:putative transcriptional regulator
MTKKTESPILAAVHETAKDLHRAGVMDQITLREFEQLCVISVEPLEPAAIKLGTANWVGCGGETGAD